MILYSSTETEHVYRSCIGMCIDRLFTEAEIDTSKVMIKRIPEVPLYDSEPNEVNLDLSIYDKSTTNPEFFRSKFLEMLPQYDGYTRIYTDGSKQDKKAAFGLS